MAAVHGIKGGQDRIRLEENIPLKTPISVFIDVSSICNFHCQFCPHGDDEASKILPQSIMPVALAKKCIDDLTEFEDRPKRISFTALGEPLVNRNLPEIVAYAKEKNVADELTFTTNGSLLDHEMAKKLIDAGINRFDVSIYGLDSATYKKFSDVSISFEKIVDNIKYLNSIKGDVKLIVKITDAVFNSTEDEKKFYEIFTPICDTVCVEKPVPLWYELETDVAPINSDKNIYNQSHEKKEVCPSPFYVMCINSNGKITCCCNDWKNIHTFGNADKDSLEKIWNGKPLRNFQKAMLKTGAKRVCNGCMYHEFVSMENIDPYREELIKRLEKME